MKPQVILERSPYRYVQCGTLDINGMPDYRIQKFNEWTKRFTDMYFLDNQMQLDVCLEDPEYTKWLDPDPEVGAVSYTHLRAHRDLSTSRMPSSA